MATVALPEFREMVSTAHEYVAGKRHFSDVMFAAESCPWWARIHGVHPAIRGLAAEWARLGDQVWNEFGQHPERLPESEYRRRIAADLGEAD